jgi:arsenite/tail-anchored protein-transporting ATPase
MERLLNKRLIFVTGKGGVGKSTTAAALGHALARLGKKTLILETDTYSAMEDLFGFRSRGLEAVSIGPNLWASNLLAQDCFVATLTRFVPSERVARAVIGNRVASVFFKAAPSVNEVTILDQVRVFFQEESGGKPAYDHIIVDLPASGHAVTFLNVPATMHGMMRGLGPIAKMSAQVADLIRDEKTTAIVAVCLPEEMPVNETIELADNLKKTLGRTLSMAIVNMVHRAPLKDAHRSVFEKVHEALRVEAPVDHDVLIEQPGRSNGTGHAMLRLIEGNALALGWHDRDRKYLQILHDRLKGLVVEVPVFFESAGSEIVDCIASFLIAGEENAREVFAS